MSNMNIKIERSTLTDIPSIENLYASAVQFQKQKQAVPWGNIDNTQIAQEINQGRQYKLVVDEEIATVWVYNFSDPEIWQEKNKDNAIYIHRIATNPKFRGQHMVEHVFSFTENYAKEQGFSLMRLDTAGYNSGLIKLYTKNGFNFLGTTRIIDSTHLPSHYEDVDICLFERKIKYNFIKNFFLNPIFGAENLVKSK